MSRLLRDLGFQTLREFLKSHPVGSLPETADSIYVRANETPRISSYSSLLKSSELLARAIKMLLPRDQDNQLCAGYVKNASGLFDSGARVVCYAPNTSLNILKSREWNVLIQHIGDELAFFLLTRCSVVQVIHGTQVFLAGNFRALYRSADDRLAECVDRSVMFHKQARAVSFSSEDAFEYIFRFHNPSKYRDMQSSIRKTLEDVESRWRRLFLACIYESYFREELAVDGKTGILDCAVDSKKLTDFLFLVSRKLFRNILNPHSFRILKSKLSILVHRNRYEGISKSEMLRHFRISSFRFFRSARCTRHEFVLRTNVVLRFLLYMFNSLFIPVVSRLFYSTETSFSRFKVYYFPRSSWRHFSAIYIERFLENFSQVEEGAVKDYSEIRCIPKNGGARAVLNMSKSKNKRPSINRSMYSAFCVLREESVKKLGCSVLSHSEIYERVTSFLAGSAAPLYILKLDLSGCFDNIPQDGVLSLVENILSKDRYCAKSFLILEKAYGELRLRQIHKVSEDIRSMNALTRDLKLPDNKIIKENAGNEVLTRGEIEESVSSLIAGNVVKHNGRFFVQKTGIAQGSVLSTLLCSLYYGNIDRMYFDAILQRGMLIRYVDDFLVLSPSIDEIIHFLSVFNSISHLGIELCREKIESNFGVEEYLRSSASIDEISRNKEKMAVRDVPVVWCGSRFYSRGFSVKPNVADPYFSFSVAHSCLNPGKALVSKMKNVLRNKTSALYINPRNTKVYENIYDALLFYGKKLVLFLKRMDFVNPALVERILEYSRSLMHRICRMREISITRKRIEDIAQNAFARSGVYGFVQK